MWKMALTYDEIDAHVRWLESLAHEEVW